VAAGDRLVQGGRGGQSHWHRTQTNLAKEGQLLGYKAGRYAHARQFKRKRKVIKRQRTIVGRPQREVARKMTTHSQAVQETLGQILDKAKRLVVQTASRKTVDNRAKL
jgi:transposase, IS5 family